MIHHTPSVPCFFLFDIVATTIKVFFRTPLFILKGDPYEKFIDDVRSRPICQNRFSQTSFLLGSFEKIAILIDRSLD